MKKIGFLLISLIIIAQLIGCGKDNENTDIIISEPVENTTKTTETETTETEAIKNNKEEITPESTLDAFLNGQIGAYWDDDSVLWFANLKMDPEEWDSFSIGDRVDLDNDGENELILNGPYGGLYLDARDNNCYVFEHGRDTTWCLSYTTFEDAVWIVHSDTTHGGRMMHHLTKYQGGDEIVEEFDFDAEYWDSETGKYDENSDFTYRDKKISMEEYEKLMDEIFPKD